MRSTKDKIIIKKNEASMKLYSRRGQNRSIMFYLKVKLYTTEGKDALTNLTEKIKDASDEKIIIA